MAGFEVAGGPITEVAREWRFGRFAPLYLAGIAAGAGIGLGLTFLSGGDAGSVEHPAAGLQIAPVTAPVDTAGIVEPPFTLVTTLELAQPELAPVNRAFAELELTLTQPVPEAPAPAPAVPAPQPAAAPAPASAPAQPAAQQPPAPPPAQAQAPAKPNFYLPPVSTGPATDLEQRLLDGINAERVNAGLPPYAYDAGLTKIARMRSKQLIDQNYFGHKDPYGYSMYVELLAYFGYRYAWAGENLAMNNTPVERSPERAIEGLMNSATHRANLLANDFFRIGIGEVTTPEGLHYYTMIFLG